MGNGFDRLCKMESTSDVFADAKNIVEQSRGLAFHYINRALIVRNWLLGKRISEEILLGDNKDNYGKNLIANLSKRLSSDYGKGFQISNLYDFIRFYEAYPDILHTLSGKSFSQLSWSHYRILLQVQDIGARSWYGKEASEQTWSVRTLQRNIDSQYYYRILGSKDRGKENLKKIVMTRVNNP